MGARGTIRVKHCNTDTALHFYAHWTGPDLPKILAESLERVKSAGRLNDEAYASRIIFDTLTECTGETTGYGMVVGDENVPFDIDYDVPCVEWTDEGQVIVYIIPVDLMLHGNWSTSDVVADYITMQWTAEEFISINRIKYLTSV